VIYTFYSYKGGVGRSMALANVAECFYLQGLRVLMIDWDLEAPGLEAFFYDPEADDASEIEPTTHRGAPLQGIPMVQSRLGLIDMLIEYRRSYSSILPVKVTVPDPAASAAFEEGAKQDVPQLGPNGAEFRAILNHNLPPLSTYLIPIHPPTDASPTAGGSLSLLPAGWRYRDRFPAYGQAVSSFDWEGLYASQRGKDYFDWLRGKLHELADVVLIDSRTGVTEMGGVCVRQMADVVVSFVAPNHQNVTGTVRMVRTFVRPETIAARDDRKLDTVMVPTRVDTSELNDLQAFEKQFRRLTDESNAAPQEFRELGRTFWDLWIPYRPKYSYQERRLIGPGSASVDPTKGLENAYWKLASHLALLAPEDHPIRQQFALRLQQEFPELMPKVVLSYLPDATPDAMLVQAYLREAGISMWPDLSHEGEAGEGQFAPTPILQSKHLVVVLSPGALDERGVIRKELRFARQEGKTIHLIALNRTTRDPSLPTWLQGASVFTQLSPQLLSLLRTSSAGLRAPVVTPPLAPEYVPRPAVEHELMAALLQAANSGERAVLAVWGPPGSGKTATMTHVCLDEDVVDAYPGGIYFIGAGDPTSLGQSASAIVTGHAYGDPAAARSALLQVLRSRRCLLVIDDAWTEKDIELVRGLGDPGIIVVLTRDLNLATSVARTVIRMDRLTSQESAVFLPGAEDIAEQLGRWPLTLSLARTALRQEATLRQTPADAQESLRDRIRRHGVVAFDRREGQQAEVRERGDTAGQGEVRERDPSAERNASVAVSIEYSLVQLKPWERKRFEQLAGLCGERTVLLPEIADQWRKLPAASGEPRPLTVRHLEALARRLGEVSLVIWEPGTQSLTIERLVHDYLVVQGIAVKDAKDAAKGRVSSGRDRQNNADVKKAREVLAGASLPLDELASLAKRLKNARYFSYARQLFARLRQLPGAAERRLYWAQQHALCTYKDPDIPFTQRADRALEILGEVEDLKTTTDQETLGLAGAIYKYKWGVDGQIVTLERSLAYYLRGYGRGVEGDYGYTGINAAFVLDLIAFQEEREAARVSREDNAVSERRQQARRIRQQIVDLVPPLARRSDAGDLGSQWWFLATIGEAYFGLQRFDDARFWLREALAAEVQEWEFQSTARQLAHLALLQGGGAPPTEDSLAFQTLRVFLGNDNNALRSVTTAKVGLALSGGGFRASLFHIGVLARLAELDMLRHVEVLSCVSGGSIIGAYYYLRVKQLLETTADLEITREHYIDLVKRIEQDFLNGVQTNPRMRLAANPWINLKSFFLPHYTRTDRLGELLEACFYAELSRQPETYLDQLLVQSDKIPADFAPKLDNWHRAAKVPILILNATTLNTGHNWQFTASFMGEPPAAVGREVDGNDLLRRMYYWEAPKAHRRVRLGKATAASACVPGLFDPVEFEDLYPKRTIRLVDGGVHDNQGVGGLLEQECSVLLVSDASGQASSVNYPRAGPFQVSLRASGIQGARVRDSQYFDLDARRRSGQIKSLMFIHLKKDLNTDPVDWLGCLDPYEVTDEARPRDRRGPLTAYGVRKHVQGKLAAIRTDLDSFNDAEAYALMLSGYRMTGHEFAECVEGFPTSKAVAGDWRFLSVEPAMDDVRDFDEAHEDLTKILRASSSMSLKVWRLSRGLQLIGVVLVGLLAWLLKRNYHEGMLAHAWRPTVAVVLAFFLAPLWAWAVFRLFGVRKPFAQLLSGLFFGTVGWIPARLHLWLFDPGYLALASTSTSSSTGTSTTTATTPTRFTGMAKTRAWRRAMGATLLLAVAVGLQGPPPSPSDLALAAEARGDFAGARDQWTRVLAQEELPLAYVGRARANTQLGRFADAVTDYSRAITLGEGGTGVYRDRWYAYLRAGDYSVPLYVYDSLVADSVRRHREAARDSAFVGQTAAGRP
jgi:predicted acylesterase/phospholipase RssA